MQESCFQAFQTYCYFATYFPIVPVVAISCLFHLHVTLLNIHSYYLEFVGFWIKENIIVFSLLDVFSSSLFHQLPITVFTQNKNEYNATFALLTPKLHIYLHVKIFKNSQVQTNISKYASCSLRKSLKHQKIILFSFGKRPIFYTYILKFLTGFITQNYLQNIFMRIPLKDFKAMLENKNKNLYHSCIRYIAEYICKLSFNHQLCVNNMTLPYAS